MRFVLLLVLLLFSCKDSTSRRQSQTCLSFAKAPSIFCKDRPVVSNNNTAAADSSVVAKPDTLSLIFAGDIMQHLPQVTAAYDPETGDYDYTPCFRYAKKHWQQADLVIGNLETTLTDRNFTGYPMFASPWQLARDLKKSGMDIVVTANNHCCDRGKAGILKTLHYLDSVDLAHTGTFADSADYKPMIVEIKGFRIALLNYTYGTNGMPVPKGTVVPHLDSVQILRDIRQARRDSARHIIAFVHWGNEYSDAPDRPQRETGDLLQRYGADIVIGSHPHVVQTMQYNLHGGDTTGIRVYSLGNYISNQSRTYTNGGISAVLHLIRQPDSTVSYRLAYINHLVSRPVVNGKKQYVVVPECDMGVIENEYEKTVFRDFIRHTGRLIGPEIRKIDEWSIE